MHIQYTHCPVCGHNTLFTHLQVPDFCVTQQPFEIITCNECTAGITQQVPDMKHIAPYYHFDNYISHTDTKDSLFHKIYHKVRNFTLWQKLQWVKKYTYLQQGKILDIGSGTGAFLKKMQQHNWQIEGIEADDVSRENAKKINGIEALTHDAINNLPASTYDAITMWHVLEHVHDMQLYMQQICKALQPNGVLIIAVPNYKSYDAQYYKQAWAAYDVPRHLYHFSAQAMQALALKNGFEIKAYKPMWFDSFYVSILSAGYNNSSKIAAVGVAFLSNIKALFNSKLCSSVTYVLVKKG
jgi:2-polyprenyl-3-methyl-5-hydroxy-6-metoxy-1,4-benzoquinol methylase